MSDIPTEHQEQIGFVNWFKCTYPQYPIFAIPNGEKRAISVAKRLKAEGVVSGVPDLCIVLNDARVLWVEMKRVKSSKLSPEQKTIHANYEELGHTVIVGYGATDASKKIVNYFENMLASYNKTL